jgi:hypothetical protein
MCSKSEEELARGGALVELKSLATGCSTQVTVRHDLTAVIVAELHRRGN